MGNLRQAVLELIKSSIEGGSYEGAEYYVERALCGARSIGGLTYFEETGAFYDKHEDEILELAEELDMEFSPVKLGGVNLYKHEIAWFAFEALKGEVFEEHKAEFGFKE